MHSDKVLWNASPMKEKRNRNNRLGVYFKCNSKSLFWCGVFEEAFLPHFLSENQDHSTSIFLCDSSEGTGKRKDLIIIRNNIFWWNIMMSFQTHFYVSWQVSSLTVMMEVYSNMWLSELTLFFKDLLYADLSICVYVFLSIYLCTCVYMYLSVYCMYMALAEAKICWVS